MQDTATIKTFPRLGLSLVVPEGTDVLSEQPLVLALPLSQERCQVFGNDGWRTLLHHAVEGRAVTVVQWWTVVDGRGVVASGSCWTPHYDLLADTFCEIQERARFDDE
jgi:hypothetical protein